jgi:hypothetical protein
MDDQTRQIVRHRAQYRCEYCHLPQAGHDERFSVDHIRPTKHGGNDALSNLALSCLRCNLYKGSNLTGIDPQDGTVVPLFDPRRDNWLQHFHWNGPFITSETSTGRTTIQVMGMNSSARVQLRRTLIAEGLLRLD